MIILIVCEGIQPRGFAPEACILRVVKLMLDDCQFLKGLEVIHHRCCPFERIHIELLAVGVYIHRLGRIDVWVSRRLLAWGIELLLADEFDADATICRLCRLANLWTHHLCLNQ